MKYFTRGEFACKCGCGQDTVDGELGTILDDIRGHFKRPITVTSGNRCPRYNFKVGGAEKSLHVLSRAADIQVEGVDPSVVADYAESRGVPGVGRYATFTHVDSRGNGPARWG